MERLSGSVSCEDEGAGGWCCGLGVVAVGFGVRLGFEVRLGQGVEGDVSSEGWSNRAKS